MIHEREALSKSENNHFMRFAKQDTSVQGPSDKQSDRWDFRSQFRDAKNSRKPRSCSLILLISVTVIKLNKIEICLWPEFWKHSFIISPWSSRKVKLLCFMLSISMLLTKGTIKISYKFKRKRNSDGIPNSSPYFVAFTRHSNIKPKEREAPGKRRAHYFVAFAKQFLRLSWWHTYLISPPK